MSLGSSLLVPVSLTKGVQDLVEIVADNDSNLINTDESNTMSIKQFQSIFGAAGWHEDAQYSRGGHQWGRQGDAGVVWSGVGHGSGLGVGSYGSCQRVMYVSQSSDFLNSHWPPLTDQVKVKKKYNFQVFWHRPGGWWTSICTLAPERLGNCVLPHCDTLLPHCHRQFILGHDDDDNDDGDEAVNWTLTRLLKFIQIWIICWKITHLA